MGKSILFGLDGEMSGADLVDGHVLIQVGAAISGEDGESIDTFSSLLNVQPRSSNWWSERAAQVHGFTIEDIDNAPPAEEVDFAFHQWLLEHGATPDRRDLVPVGFNVVGFDMPFMRAALPLSCTVISRRGVDLNSLCYLLSGWDPNAASSSARSFAGWKRTAKRAVDARVREVCAGLEAHDAGFDAVQALLVYDWLSEQVHKCHQPSRQPVATGLAPSLVERLGITNRQAEKLSVLLSSSGVTNPGKWMSKSRDVFGGATAFQMISSGKIDLVVSLLKTKSI